MKKKKFSKLNLIYVFSMILGITIVVCGFSAANSAKKRIEEQMQIQQSEIREDVGLFEKEDGAKVVSKPSENIVDEETVVLEAAPSAPAVDEFAPDLEDCIITKPAEGLIMTQFSGNSLVFSEFYNDWRVHKGIDISADELSQVKAAANGRVRDVYSRNGVGLVIEIQHGDFITRYANLSTDELVSAGDEVYAGDIISGVGKRADGKSFLHFEIEYKGEDIDPEPLITQ